MAVTRNEVYNFMFYRFNVWRAAEILENSEVVQISASLNWNFFHRTDEKYAMTTDISQPVFIAQIFINGEISNLMIDGNHRNFRACKEGVAKIPAKILTVEQSFEIMSCFYGAEKQLMKLRREAKKAGYKLKSIRKQK